MNGPGCSKRRSMARHWFITISSWSQVFFASLPARAIMRALLSRTASISALWSWMWPSLVMISHPWRAVSGIHTRVVSLGVRDGTRRALAKMDGPAGIAWIGHIGPESHEYLGQPHDVSVDVEADSRRLGPPAHAARRGISYARAQPTSL